MSGGILLTESQDVAHVCARLNEAHYVAVDTEFLRERTFWPKLCLVQIAGPSDVVAIDALAPGLDLSPLFELMADKKVTKVFHAGRQDIEIFHHLSGAVPNPLFDTQIAAMVCGFGDSVSYESLALRVANARIDKSSRFTDWTHRPLTSKQLSYALDDVRHLRVIYDRLVRRLFESGRVDWVREEMAALADPKVYEMLPENAWRRLKTHSTKPRFLAVLRAVAAWREQMAQTKDVPRNRICRDEALIEIAAHVPATADELARTRGLNRGFANGAMGRELLAAVARGKAVPESDCPVVSVDRTTPRAGSPVVDLLKVLLKLKCAEHEVAQKLVASAADIEKIVADDDADIPALRGWRRTVFGADALALKAGRIALVADGKHLRIVHRHPGTSGR